MQTFVLKEYRRTKIGWGIFLDFFDKKDAIKRGTSCYYFYELRQTYYLPRGSDVFNSNSKEVTAAEFAEHQFKHLKNLYRTLAKVELFPIYKLDPINA